jgi:hypothetical protein
MQVMRDFCPDDQKEQIDKAIHMMTTFNTYRNIRTNLGTRPGNMHMQSGAEDESIHDDGIYDIDTACFIKNEAKKADVLSALMMMVFMGEDHR